MALTVLYFAGAREAAGTPRETLDQGPATVGALRALLLELHPGLARVLPRIVANQELAAYLDTLRPRAAAARAARR